MDEPVNPYAAPASLAPAVVVPAWHAAPDESLRQLATGLGVVRIATFVMLVETVALFALGWFPVLGRMGRDTSHLVHVCIPYILLVAQGLGLIGVLHCLSAPAATRPRGWVGATALAAMLNIILSVGALVHVGATGAWYTRDLFGIFGPMTFLMFLLALARFLGRKHLAQLAFLQLVLSGLLVAVLLAYMAIAGVFTSHGIEHLPVPAPLEMMFYRSVASLMYVLPIVLDLLLLILLANLRSAILAGQPLSQPQSEHTTVNH
ncbi:MAG TPA: hypothetical protein VHX65_20285 [Pirellulales bacterium]|nr:hypothetical protein [Pirellulales bacterium]